MIEQYDHMPPHDAALAAWTRPGANPEYHERMKDEVRRTMPLLARALDRPRPQSRYEAITAVYACATCGHPSTAHDGGRECWHKTGGRYSCDCRKSTRPQETT